MPSGRPRGIPGVRPSARPNVVRQQRRAHRWGFAYVLLLLAVAVVAVSAAATLRLGAHLGRRDAEQALLFVGSEFERALRSYAKVPATATENSGSTNPALLLAQGPRTLEELLKDPRSPGVQRHLRQMYADPMTGLPTWGLIKNPAGFIVGVYSLAEGKPIKQTGFAPQQMGFENAAGYAHWVFGLPGAQPKR
jgi:type II secretory pathway pseudopilin PulG